MKVKSILAGQLICQCKGGRRYVHGTDVYNMFFKSLSVNHLFSEGFKNISTSFKKILTSETVHYEVYDNNVIDKSAHVLINFIANNKKYYAILTGATDTVKESYSFDESDITKYCLLDIENKKITLSKRVIFTPIEIFTAMNKKLLNSLFPPDKEWLMTKFESFEYYGFINYKTISVIMKKSFLLKLIKSDIYADKVKIGSIYFSESK